MMSITKFLLTIVLCSSWLSTHSYPMNKNSNLTRCVTGRQWSEGCRQCICVNNIPKCAKHNCDKDGIVKKLMKTVPKKYMNIEARRYYRKYNNIIGDELWNSNYGDWRQDWLTESGYNYRPVEYNGIYGSLAPSYPGITPRAYRYAVSQSEFVPTMSEMTVDDLVYPARTYNNLMCRGNIVSYNADSCEICFCNNTGRSVCYKISCKQVPPKSLPRCNGDGELQVGCMLCSCWFGKLSCDKSTCGLYAGPLDFKPTPWREHVNYLGTGTVTIQDASQNWCDGNMSWHQGVPKCSKCTCIRGRVKCMRDDCYSVLTKMNSCEGDGRMKKDNCNTCVCRDKILQCSTNIC